MPSGKASRKLLAPVLVAALAISSGCGSVAPSGTASKDGALVVDGETIASTDLWQAAQKEGSLTAYFSYPEQISKGILAQFEKETGIKVDLVRLASSALYERIQSEQGANKLTADVVSLSEPMLYQKLIGEGIIEPYKVSTFDAIPPAQKAADGAWYAEINLISTIVYNNKVVKEADAPKNWTDLTSPRWQKSIGFNQIGSGGFAYTTFLFLRDKYGVDYWKQLSQQKPLLTNGVGALTEQLARGEVSVAMDHLGTVKEIIKDGAPLSVVYPPDGVASSQEMLGVTSSAEHPDTAKLYLEWATSRHGGSVIADISGEYAANPEAAPPKNADGSPAPTLSELKAYVPRSGEYDANHDKYTAEWNSIFGYLPTSN